MCPHRALAQAEVLRRAQAQLHELLIEQETWRVQTSQQADTIAAAMSASAHSQGQVTTLGLPPGTSNGPSSLAPCFSL